LNDENNSTWKNRVACFLIKNANRIAYFISPHGFGHAARAAAVMEAMAELAPATCFDIFTGIPSWFFEDTLPCGFDYHPLLTDIGLSQKNAFETDLDETQRQLDAFLPFNHATVLSTAKKMNRLGCTLVICDIAPLGIVAAGQAGIPSVLVENFTWDWIYAGYLKDRPRMASHVNYLKRIFETADIHIQTAPVCKPAAADLTTLPVSRKVKTAKPKLKARLGLTLHEKTVVISSGGIPQTYGFLEKLKDHKKVRFIIPGGSKTAQTCDNLVLLPHHSAYYHPDLVNLSDAVVGKAGYSTLAEVYHSGVPFGYIQRRDFRESAKLAAFIKNRMPCIGIEEPEFHDGSWIPKIENLLKLAPTRRNESNGAAQIASFLLDFLKNR